MTNPTFDENGYLATVVVYAKKLTELTNELVALRRQVVDLEQRLSPILSEYERNRHLDLLLSDEKLPDIGMTGRAVLYNIWQAVKIAAGDGGRTLDEVGT